METLSTVTSIALLVTIAAYGIYHWRLAQQVQNRYHKMASDSSLTVEQPDETLEHFEAITFVSYNADDPLAIRFDYGTSMMDFGSLPKTYDVSVGRDVLAQALATGQSQDISPEFSVFCSQSHKKGKGKTTLVLRSPHRDGSVHILTVPTKTVLKVVNASYAIVAPGEEFNEPSNNLDEVIEQILTGNNPPVNG